MSQQNEIAASPLGRETRYVNQYDPSLLHPIARANVWRRTGLDRCPWQGVDIWNGWEVSWLNARGKPVVAWAEFRIPADSPCLIESKSFKLYLNSFNLTRFGAQEEVARRMEADLSAAAGAAVGVTLRPLDGDYRPGRLPGRCIDELDIEVSAYQPQPELLQANREDVAEESLVSHLLKSNCPVTGQPDWASVAISYRGPKIDEAGLLAYLISYREHGDFHEQCVEQIFADIWQRCAPERLTVCARYVRRGGLDINPWRSSEPGEPDNLRLWRQ